MRNTNFILTFLFVYLGGSFEAACAESGDYILAFDKTSIVFIVAGLFISLGLMCFARSRFYYKPPRQLGFLSIVPHRQSEFFHLSGKVHNMIPVVETLADENINVYSNLSKITLTVKSSGVFSGGQKL